MTAPTNHRMHQCASTPCVCDLSLTCPAAPDADQCTVDDCQRTRERSSVYCSAHRARLRRTGSLGTAPVVAKRPAGFTCESLGCEKPGTAARGLCSKHYARLLRHGKPEGRTTLDRFMDKVVVAESGCWVWQGKPDPGGYGTLAENGRGGAKRRAHRMAYELLVGPIPEGMQLDHLCHTRDTTCLAGTACPHRRCVNPEHLEPVTPQENTRRGRSPGMLVKASGMCSRGHDPSELTTSHRGNGRPFSVCRACARLTAAQRKATREVAA